MAIAYYSLEDSNGNIYNFNGSFNIVNSPWSLRSDIKSFLYANGGEQNGDRYVSPRKIIIEGVIYADTLALFETAWSALKKAIIKGGKLKKSNDIVPRYLTVELADIDIVNEHERFKEVSITFDVPYPFMEDEIETESINVMAGNGNFSIDVSTAEHIILPTIQIDSDQSVDVPGILLRNVDDGGTLFIYNNANFLSGSTLIIDSREGTIKLNNNLAMEFIVQGTFLRLQPKVNNIYFEGNACTITFKYRKVYL